MTDSIDRPLFVLYTAPTNHASAQPGTWGARFMREHVDAGRFGPSSAYWMVPSHLLNGGEDVRK